MSCNFCVRDNCLISYSFFIAICFVSYVSTNTTSKGPRPRVYLAPLPSRCFVRRCFKLLVYPVYSVLSLHFKIYTTCSKLPIDNVLKSEKKTSELKSRGYLVCRLLLA